MACPKCGYRKDGPGVGQCFCGPSKKEIEERAAQANKAGRKALENMVAGPSLKDPIYAVYPAYPPTRRLAKITPAYRYDALDGTPIKEDEIQRCDAEKTNLCLCQRQQVNCKIYVAKALWDEVQRLKRQRIQAIKSVYGVSP